MKCIHCNHKLPDDSEFCQYCGNKTGLNTSEETAANASAGFVLDDNISASPVETKKEKKNKTKYCSRCGSVIDKQTKICTGCGRKYFKVRLNKFSITILIMSIVIVALSALNVFLLVDTKAEISELNAQVSTLEKQVNSKKKTINTLREENSDLRDKNTDYFLEHLFFSSHAVIVSDDGTRKYHKYGCDDLDTSSFWIYNSEAAEDKGYYACSKCCD